MLHAANRSALLITCAGLLAALCGCPGGSISTEIDGAPPGLDLLPAPADGDHADYPVVYACDTVDILFVIDNSDSMAEEQQNLVDNVAGFIQRIEAITPPLESYHVGVISTDIGAGPYSGVMMGSCVPGGDEARLQHAPREQACGATYPRFLTGPSPSLTQDFACVAKLGHAGCGYEQQLEAALMALTAQPYNDGFMRRNAPLAIIFITDEDDCSASDTSLFNPDDATLGPYPLRCVQHEALLHPVERYIQAFKALKDNPARVVVAAITGPQAAVQIDAVTNRVLPACSSPEFGSSLPGNRFSQLIQSFGDRGVQESLCQGDLAAPLEIVGKAIERACLE